MDDPIQADAINAAIDTLRFYADMHHTEHDDGERASKALKALLQFQRTMRGDKIVIDRAEVPQVALHGALADLDSFGETTSAAHMNALRTVARAVAKRMEG